MRGKLILIMLYMLSINFGGCEQKKPEILTEETEMDTYNEKTFLMETYGLSEEEIQGIDAVRLVHNYQMKERDYTAEEVREILKNEGDVYLDDGTTELYSILDKKSKDKINENISISKIAYHYNEGTFNQKAVFDLTQGIYFADNSTKHLLSEKQQEVLKNIVIKWDISKWDIYYQGEEEDSTGSLAWKFVFESVDGNYFVYSGYTKDGSNLPDNFSNVLNELRDIVSKKE